MAKVGKLFYRAVRTRLEVATLPGAALFRVVFFGLPLAAGLLVRDGHDVALAALSRAEPGTRRLRRLLGGGRVLVRPSTTDPGLVERVRALAPDLLVSWFWTRLLPMALVQCARLGGIGAH